MVHCKMWVFIAADKVGDLVQTVLLSSDDNIGDDPHDGAEDSLTK